MAHGDVTHIEIPVDDFDKAKAFYGTLFGWETAAWPGYDDYFMWSAPNKVSGGALTSRADDFTQPRSYVEVDSIDAVLAAVEGLGGAVVSPKVPITNTSWMAVIRDPAGNVMGLFEGTA